MMDRAAGLIYVIGSATFGRHADRHGDSDHRRVERCREDGGCSSAASDYWPNGASGIGSCLLIRGSTLHAFTFDTRDSSTSPNPPVANEHWSIDMNTKVATKLPDLPYSKRSAFQGYGTSGSHWDAARNLIMVTGRFGEIVWRDEKGIDKDYFGIPGKWAGQNTNCWRCATVNHDTWALAFGDHEAEIDEIRGGGTGLAMGADGLRVQHGVVKAIKPLSNGYLSFCVAQYLPSLGHYRPVVGGCPNSDGDIPCSYLSDLPLAPQPNFALQFMSDANLVGVILKNKPLRKDLTPFGAPGCTLEVTQGLILPAIPNAQGIAELRFAIPTGMKLGTYVQWFEIDPKANALGIAVSCARKLEIR